MRTAPIALRYRNDSGAIERISRQESSLTHHDPLAGEACAFFNLTVAALVRGKRPPTLGVAGRPGRGGALAGRPSSCWSRCSARSASC